MSDRDRLQKVRGQLGVAARTLVEANAQVDELELLAECRGRGAFHPLFGQVHDLLVSLELIGNDVTRAMRCVDVLVAKLSEESSSS